MDDFKEKIKEWSKHFDFNVRWIDVGCKNYTFVTIEHSKVMLDELSRLEKITGWKVTEVEIDTINTLNIWMVKY